MNQTDRQSHAPHGQSRSWANAEQDHYYRVRNGEGVAVFSFEMAGFEAALVRSRCEGEMIFEHCEPHHRVLITLAGGTAMTYAEAEGASPVDRPDKAGTLSIVPAGTRRRVLLKDSAMSLLTVAIAPDFIAEDAPLAPPPLMQNGRDNWLWHAGAAFQRAATSGGTLELEGLAVAMARHLQRLSGRGQRRLATGLPPAALGRVLSLMRERLPEDLTLADLAGECGLSISAFGRAFRQSTGVTPQRYLTMLRIRRAMELLRDAELPVAVIARAVGYSDQAHFTTAFARHTGMPPARWRASR